MIYYYYYYRLSNRDGLHLNKPGRKTLIDRLVNVIIPSRQSVAPSATRCRPVPQHQQVQQSKTAPQPIPRKQRPQQHPPRERPLQPPPRQRTQHVSSQQRTTVTSKKWNLKMNAVNQHSSQPRDICFCCIRLSSSTVYVSCSFSPKQTTNERQKYMACPATSNDSTSTEQHSVGPSSVSGSIATGRHDTDNMVNITDINTTVHYDNLICNITPDISD